MYVYMYVHTPICGLVCASICVTLSVYEYVYSMCILYVFHVFHMYISLCQSALRKVDVAGIHTENSPSSSYTHYMFQCDLYGSHRHLQMARALAKPPAQPYSSETIPMVKSFAPDCVSNGKAKSALRWAA